MSNTRYEMGQPPIELASQAMRDYQRQRQMTLGDLLLENRVIFLQGEIYDGNANELVMKLLYLQSENRRKDIHFYINSPGGSVTATLAIYDTMQMISCPVATYCVGLAASGGAVLLAGGEKFLPAIRSGEKTQTIRLWKFRHMRSGQRSYIPGVGYIRVTLVEPVDIDALTDADAIPDGFLSAADLQHELRTIYGDKLAQGHQAFRIAFEMSDKR